MLSVKRLKHSERSAGKLVQSLRSFPWLSLTTAKHYIGVVFRGEIQTLNQFHCSWKVPKRCVKAAVLVCSSFSWNKFPSKAKPWTARVKHLKHTRTLKKHTHIDVLIQGFCNGLESKIPWLYHDYFWTFTWTFPDLLCLMKTWCNNHDKMQISFQLVKKLGVCSKFHHLFITVFLFSIFHDFSEPGMWK